jgi:hypothetical protein
MSNSCSMIFLASCFSLLLVAAAHSERVLTSHADMEVVLQDDYECSKTVPLTVRSNTDDAFVGDRVELQRLLGGLRIMFAFECPEAENIVIDGEVGGEQVFRGTADKEEDWQLIVLMEPQVRSGKGDQPQENDAIAEVSSPHPANTGIPTVEWCGPDGQALPEKTYSFVTPDNLLEPFRDACRKHDECYTAKAKKNIQSIEIKYEIRVANVDALEDYKTEVSDLFEEEKSYCDGAFFGSIHNACISIARESSTDKVVTEKSIEKCAKIATAYFVGITSRVDQKAFDRALENALKSR